jgi:hypothetical protein
MVHAKMGTNHLSPCRFYDSNKNFLLFLYDSKDMYTLTYKNNMVGTMVKCLFIHSAR